jgi:hypothetical protein
MQITGASSLPTPLRSSTPKEAAPPQAPDDAFKTSPPQEPGLGLKVVRSACQGGIAASGLMLATAVSTAFKSALGGFLSPVIGAGIGALTGGVVASQRAKHRGQTQEQSAPSVLTGVAAGAALGAASSFSGLALPMWGAGLVAGGAAEFL